jgi:Alpha/beta hydrolase family
MTIWGSPLSDVPLNVREPGMGLVSGTVRTMRAILVHGMGRTPLSMQPLARRLRAKGIEPALFGYSATFEGWEGCRTRLRRFIETRRGKGDFVVIGHSLGCVLIRAVAADLEVKPSACFFLAPPSCACRAARTLSRRRLYKLVTGEMGRLLAEEDFMRSLPPSAIPTKVYAGGAGPRGRWSPFGQELNDGILAVSETRIDSIPVQVVPSIHTFIMNSTIVAQDIAETIAGR